MKKKLINIVVLVVCIALIIPNFVFAEEIKAGQINTEEYSGIYSKAGTSKVTKMGGSILAVVQAIGISVGVICLIILGIKYMYSSTDEKANIKERLIPYAIGAVIMFGGTGLLTIIVDFAQKVEL